MPSFRPLVRLLRALSLAAAAFAAPSLLAQDPACDPLVTTMIAGQNTAAGEIEITNDAHDLIITVTGTGGWHMGALHVYAGLGPVPTNKGGNVAPGQFPYSVTFGSPEDSYTLRIPLADLGVTCGQQLNIAVHAEMLLLDCGCHILAEETGWGWGSCPFPGSQWGWTIRYTPCCVELCG